MKRLFLIEYNFVIDAYLKSDVAEHMAGSQNQIWRPLHGRDSRLNQQHTINSSVA